MSVLIRGIEMPVSCSACPMLEGDRMDGLCHAASKWLDDDEHWTWYVYPEGDMDDSKPCNCPLVPVPPHGRLIDEDALLKGCGYIIADGMACIPVKYIAAAPTIIPADGKDICVLTREGGRDMSEDCPHCVFEKTEDNCPGCFEGSHYRPKPITNADKLRSLSNWDLAMFFGKSDECPPSNPKCEHECNICWNEWLESEVENDQWGSAARDDKRSAFKGTGGDGSVPT